MLKFVVDGQQRQAIEEKMKQQERRDDEERREGLEGERIQQKVSK